jgi:hypothetical protein
VKVSADVRSDGFALVASLAVCAQGDDRGA